jgi:hypothetical protein
MQTTTSLILLCAFALSVYTVGASAIEGQLNYRTWHLLGATDGFRAYHKSVGPRVVALLVGPFTVGLALTLALLAWRPPGTPLGIILLALLLDAIPIAATLGWQVPAQRRLDRDGFSRRVIEGLIRREWFRFLPHLAKAILLMWLVARMIPAATEVPS